MLQAGEALLLEMVVPTRLAAIIKLECSVIRLRVEILMNVYNALFAPNSRSLDESLPSLFSWSLIKSLMYASRRGDCDD